MFKKIIVDDVRTHTHTHTCGSVRGVVNMFTYRPNIIYIYIHVYIYI